MDPGPHRMLGVDGPALLRQVIASYACKSGYAPSQRCQCERSVTQESFTDWRLEMDVGRETDVPK